MGISEQQNSLQVLQLPAFQKYTLGSFPLKFLEQNCLILTWRLQADLLCLIFKRRHSVWNPAAFWELSHLCSREATTDASPETTSRAGHAACVRSLPSLPANMGNRKKSSKYKKKRSSKMNWEGKMQRTLNTACQISHYLTLCFKISGPIVLLSA